MYQILPEHRQQLRHELVSTTISICLNFTDPTKPIRVLRAGLKDSCWTAAQTSEILPRQNHHDIIAISTGNITSVNGTKAGSRWTRWVMRVRRLTR